MITVRHIHEIIQYLLTEKLSLHDILKETDYPATGQFVIKGTEVSFYIPPTGIEVIPLDRNSYVREAVTLERLEYCILKKENVFQFY